MSKHSALDGLIAEVPFAHEGWTSERRAEFLKAFELVLDYCVPINEPTRARERDAEKGEGERRSRSGEDVRVTLQRNDVRNTGEQVVGRAANLAKFAEAALAFAEHPRSSSEGRRLSDWSLRAEMALERAWELLTDPYEKNV